MPIKLLPHLRLLNPCLPVTRFPSMNLQPSIRTIPTFSRIFPFKLRYLGLTRLNQQPQVRKLSTRPFRSRPGSDFGRNRERGRGGEIRASKSLIEDEAELSDWVSELGSDSFRAKRNSRYDEEESDFKTARGGRGREKDSFPMKRGRENDSNEFHDSRRKLNGKPPNTNSNSFSRFNRRFDGESRDNGHSRKRSRGIERGNVDSLREKRNERGGFKKDGMKLRREARFSDDDGDNIIGDYDKDVERGKGIRDLLGEEVSDVDDDDDDSDGDLRQDARNSIALDKEDGEMCVKRSSPGKDDSYLSESRFDQCSISPLSLKGIKGAGYEKMTVVQAATLPLILKGKDVLAKAKTGTGKTVAFLLPSIEVVIKSPPVGRDQKRPPFLVLVICPTRELASQAATEANTLSKYHPSIGVQVVIGGTRLALEQKRMQTNPCQIGEHDEDLKMGNTVNQIWRNVLTLKNSLMVSTVAAKKSTLCVASFHSTSTSFEKWRNKWNDDVGRAQQPTKSYVRYHTRQKRADAKKALKDLLFSSGSSKNSFQNDDPIWKFEGNNEWEAESDTKGRSKSSARRSGKPDQKKMKRKHRKENFSGDYDDPEKIFQEKFGKRWYTWSFQSWKGSSFESSSSGFEWREHSNRTSHRNKEWETISDAESDEELSDVGSCSDRTILGLPTRGRLTMEDVKVAFRSSALKWHPDKHQGSSKAMAEEKFKLCLNAYKSLCDALS